MKPIHFNTCDALTAPRCKLERNAACSTKEVKNLFVFEDIPVVKNVKKVLTCKVSGWSCLEVFPWSKNPAFEGPANYSHL